jgi:hypothetical protein
VLREIDHWLGTHPVDRLLIVLTAGELTWNRSTGTFDAERTTALPARLMSAFAEEPLYLDLRWARSEDQLSSRHPRFRDAVADLAAALHGGEKDDLVGEDVRQHRRARRLAAAAIAVSARSANAVAIFAVAQRNGAVATGCRWSRAGSTRAAALSLQSTAILTQLPERLPPRSASGDGVHAPACVVRDQSVATRLAHASPLIVRSQAEDHPAGYGIAFPPSRSAPMRRTWLWRAPAAATLLDLVRGKPVAVLKHDGANQGTIRLEGERDAVPFRSRHGQR